MTLSSWVGMGSGTFDPCSRMRAQLASVPSLTAHREHTPHTGERASSREKRYA